MEQISASSDECAQWLRQAESVSDFTALHSMQSNMINKQVERVSSYWNRIGHAVTQLQMELSGTLQDCSAKATQDVRHQVEQLQTDLSKGAASVLKPVLEPGALFAFGSSEKDEQHGEDSDPGDHNGSSFVSRSASAKRAHR